MLFFAFLLSFPSGPLRARKGRAEATLFGLSWPLAPAIRPKRAGSPWAVTRPGRPQIRTCAINAYGSSSHRFAFPLRYPLALRLPETEVRRPRQVSRQRFCGSALPSLSRVPAVRVSRRPWYYEVLRRPVSRSPHFVSFAWRYHPVRLCSFLPQARRRLGAWSFRDWQPRASLWSGDEQGLPGSWRTLLCLCPVL